MKSENDGNMIKRMFALDILVSLSLAHRCVTSLSTWPETVALNSPHGEEQPKKDIIFFILYLIFIKIYDKIPLIITKTELL